MKEPFEPTPKPRGARALALGFAVLSLSLAQPARAQGADDLAKARQLYESGMSHYNLGEYNDAVNDFREAYRHKQDPAFLFNIGQSYRQLGDPEKAAQSYRAYLRESKEIDPKKRAAVEKFIADAEAAMQQKQANQPPTNVEQPNLPTPGAAPFPGLLRPEDTGKPVAKTGKVHITASQPLARVRIDGKDYGPAPVDVDLPAGGHSLEVSAAGFQTYRGELAVGAAQQRTLAIALEPPAPEQHESVAKKWYFWTPLGLVVAGGIAAGVAIPLSATTEPPIAGTFGAGKIN